MIGSVTVLPAAVTLLAERGRRLKPRRRPAQRSAAMIPVRPATAATRFSDGG
jgi:hypothetical protein